MYRRSNLVNVAIVLVGTVVANANLFGQGPTTPDYRAQLERHQANLQELQQVLNDKSAYADAIVSRWEDDAKASGKWDTNYATALHKALLKLRPETLLAAKHATSYEGLMGLLAGRPSAKPGPANLGDAADDLVYTPITPCRIADTRIAGGPITGGTSRLFEGDTATDFTAQGGSATNCLIPDNVAYALAMTITVINPPAIGYLTAYGYFGPVPTAATMIYYAGEILSTTTINPITPGAGPDFNVFTSQTTHLAIDVLGYFSAPQATPLNCTSVSTAETPIPVNMWTAVDATCPSGFTVTGGGWFTNEGTLGYPGVWVLSVPSGGNGWRTWVDNQTSGSRNIQTWAQCCQVPGR